MAENNNVQLDQLWFTMSPSGLGSMAMGYRVRAASEGFHDMQSMRYRRVNRFLSYELPQGANINDFNSRIAPVSLCFVNNGDEKLLIRKVFTGLDAAGRNGNFFTHLIAGLPQNFTARDAIRLWACSELWVESDQGKAPKDTLLPKIPYSTIQDYVQHSQTMFNVTQISEQLQNLLQVILSQGVSPHIYTTGHSTFTAALIYGLTHCLPTTLLDGLTFSTYESNPRESEAILVGTINGANLSDITTLQVQPSAPIRPFSDDVQHYARIALNSFTTGNMTKFSRMVDEAERNRLDTPDQLLELLNRRFRHGPMTIKQLEHMVQSPNDSIDDLLDPSVQQYVAHLLLSNQEYWQTAGKNQFIGVLTGLQPGVNRFHTPEARNALTLFLNGVATQIIVAMQQTILQGILPKHHVDILNTLAPLATNATLYQKMLSDFAQGETYQRAISDALGNFQLWLLHCVKFIQPQPTIQQVQPWLRTPSWNKLEGVLKLDLPDEWEQLAIFGLLERGSDIPKIAVPVVQLYETKFTALLQRLLQQGYQLPKPEYTEVVVRFFSALVAQDYPNRVALLLALLNAAPKEPSIIEKLLSIVRFGTPHQLIADEIEFLLVNCKPEVIAACGSSPALAEYIREYLLFLSPGKLVNEPVQRVLARLQDEPSLPSEIADRIAPWNALAAFLRQETISRRSLIDVRAALRHLFSAEQVGDNNQQRQKIIEELLPLLVKQIKTEPDLENAMEILGPSLASTVWEFLCGMATQAGQAYSQSQVLYRLTPYLFCGISHFPRTRLAPDVLDSYLHSLYGGLRENELRNIDMVASSGIWPELIQQEWRKWRESRKSARIENIPIVNKFIPQQPKQPTGPQPLKQPPPVSNFTVPPEPVRDSWGTQVLPEVRRMLFPEPAENQKQTPLPQLSQTPFKGEDIDKIQQPRIRGQIVATVYEHNYFITVDHYQKLKNILTQMLPFWFKVLDEQQARKKSKSLFFEIETVSALQQDIYKLSMTKPASKLITYLTDDKLLQLEFELIIRKESATAYFLRPENHLSAIRKEFQRFLAEPKYQELCHNSTEDAINDTLKLLIRRYHFIQYMDDHKKDFKKWLEKERRHVTIIDIPKSL